MNNLENHERWQYLANPGHEHTCDAIKGIISASRPTSVLNCAAMMGPAMNLTDVELPNGFTVDECLTAAGTGIIPDHLRQWTYDPKIESVPQLPFLRQLPEKYKYFSRLPWFQCASPTKWLGINARHIRYNHDLWQQLRPKVLRGVHTTLVLGMPQIGFALTPHIQLEKSFLYFGSLARGLCATQLFPARYLYPESNLEGLVDAPAPIFADLLPSTCGYAWPSVEREPNPWRVLTRYDSADRFYGYPFQGSDESKDILLHGADPGAMLLPNGVKAYARHSESLAYATMDPHLHRDLKLCADEFEAQSGLLRGTLTHDGLPFQLPVQMQCMVLAVIFGQWEMELDRPGDLTSYSLRTRHAAIRGCNFYQRIEPYYSNFMRLISEIENHPDFAAYALTSHLTDSWLSGNLRVSNRLSASEQEFGPELVRSLYRQQLDWQMGVTNLMNWLKFRTRRNGDTLKSLSGLEIERQLGSQGLVFHQLQKHFLRFDSHLFPRPVRPVSLWPNQHPSWMQLDQNLRDVTLPKV